MFDKLHLLSQDVPEGGDGFRWRAHPYLRMAGAVPRGPAVFEWSARQRADLEALWRDPSADGARERLARDLAAFCNKLGWAPDAKLLESAEHHGSDYLLTLSAVPSELYLLPWEVIEVGASGTYLSDYASTQVRYAMPGLESRPIQGAPPLPGVLFAWSAGGGEVPHEEHAAAIRTAAEAGGVEFHELADVDEARLRAALDAGPPSVLHLLCHGVPGPEGEPSRLCWGASDNPTEITATRLARLLRPHDGALRLVVLSACGSGDGHGDPMFMTSLAQEVHKKGIPSVVASRYPLSVRGSRVMTRALYDKLLREAWSLERALRHTRQALSLPDEDGETYPGDAYGIQLYAHDTECFVSDNQVQAERPVLASYPFGTAARPVPAKGPPAVELTMNMARDPGLSEDELVDRLRRASEDDGLTVAIPLDQGRHRCALLVHTTVDGAHRLLGAWRSRVLQVAVGVIVGELIITKGMPLLKGLVGVAAGKLGAAGGNLALAAGRAGTPTSQAGAGKLAAAVGKAGAAAGRAGTPTSPVGAGKVGVAMGKGVVAGQAGGAVGQAAAGTGAGKITSAIVALAGKVVSTKLAIVAVVSSVAVAGGAAVYRAETRRPAPAVAIAAQPARPAERPAGRGERFAPSPRPAVTVEPAREDEAPAETPLPIAAVPAPQPPAAAAPPVAPPASAPAPRVAAIAAPPAAAPPPALVAPEPAPAPTEPPQPAASEPAPPAPEPPALAAGASSPDPGAAAVPAGVAATGGAGAPAGAGSAGIPVAVCGNGSMEAGEQCDDGNTRDGDGCSARCTTEAPRLPVSVAPAALDLQRVSGNDDVHPSKETRGAMLRDGVSSVRGVVRLCVDTAGTVTASTITEATGYPDYDRKLVAAVREWRYRPFLLDGVPVSVCSTVEFIYAPR